MSELVTELSSAVDGEDIAGGPLERLTRMMACKAAVKAGQRLSRGEIIALIERQRGVEGSYTCPHGRPSRITFSLVDLEKRFLRR